MPDLVHPLRHKISAMKMLLAQMRDCGPLNELQEDIVRRCDDNADQMAWLVEAVLELDDAEAGRRHLEVTTFDVLSVVRSAVDALRPWAAHEDVELVTRSRVDLLRFTSDELLLRLAITELVEATVETTHGGTVVVHARRSGDELHIFVVGEGGHPAQAPPRGIGPVLAERAVTLLGGSMQGHADGRCFRVTVPPATT